MYSRVIKELENFTHCDCAPEQKEDETTKAEEMWRRNPQHKLQRESVQLRHQELQPATPAACSIHTKQNTYLLLLLNPFNGLFPGQSG